MKGLIFTVSVFVIFMLVLELAMMISLMNSSSNEMITKRIFGQKITSYSGNLASNLAEVANMEPTYISEEDSLLVSVETGFYDYNATGSLNVFEDWVNSVFNNQTSFSAAANLSGLKQAVSQGSLRMVFEPSNVEWRNRYADSRLIGFEVFGGFNSFQLNCSFNGSVESVSWTGNQPSQGSFPLTMNFNGEEFSWSLEELNYGVEVNTSRGPVNLVLNLNSEKQVSVTPGFYGADFKTSFSIPRSNIFKGQLPYNNSWVNLSANNFGLSVSNNGMII